MCRVLRILFLLLASNRVHAVCSREILIPSSELGRISVKMREYVPDCSSIIWRGGKPAKQVSTRSHDESRARALWVFARSDAYVVLAAVLSARCDEAGGFYSQRIEECISLVAQRHAHCI